MTGVVSVPGAVPGARGAGARAAGGELAARVAVGALFLVSTAVSVGWLLLGAVAAAAQYWPAVGRSVAAADAAGSTWARAIAAAAPASEPLSQAVLDYGFSVLNLVLAVVLLGAGVRRPGMRTWPIRLLAVALVGSAGAFNLQAHAAARAIETATGLVVTELHQVVLHSIACAAYILALLLFPSPSWDGLPGARPARGALAVVGTVTFLLVGLGTALLPHTTSCVLFFGFLVPAVGLVVLPRRVRRGPGPEARTQARLLFSTLVGGFAVAMVLGIVTVLLDVLGETPALTLVDPTAHGAPDAPIALLFWFSRLASAAIAVVVLVATRHDRLWTAERWFSRGLAVLLVMSVGGGGFVVLRAIAVGVLGTTGATVAATALIALGLGPLYVRAERVVDRLLYGTRPAPYRVLADITALTRSTLPSTGASATAPDLARVAEAVARGLGAGLCRLTVRRPGLRDRTYEWTDRVAGFGTADLVEVPVRHGAEQVGVLAVDRQAVSGLHAQRSHLLTDIADGLGVVLEASRSGIELERQLRAALAHAEEIAVSRRRTVAEMDGERRRIERDLHDGAQHHLVSLRLTLGLVEHQVATGDLDQARDVAREARRSARRHRGGARGDRGRGVVAGAGREGAPRGAACRSGCRSPAGRVRRRRARADPALPGRRGGGRLVLLRRGGRQRAQARPGRAHRGRARRAVRCAGVHGARRGPGFRGRPGRGRWRAGHAQHDRAALGGGRTGGGPVGAGGGDDRRGHGPAAGGEPGGRAEPVPPRGGRRVARAPSSRRCGWPAQGAAGRARFAEALPLPPSAPQSDSPARCRRPGHVGRSARSSPWPSRSMPGPSTLRRAMRHASSGDRRGPDRRRARPPGARRRRRADEPGRAGPGAGPVGARRLPRQPDRATSRRAGPPARRALADRRARDRRRRPSDARGGADRHSRRPPPARRRAGAGPVRLR